MAGTKYRLEDQSYFLAPRREGTYWERDERTVIAESDSLEELAHIRADLPTLPDHDYFIKAADGSSVVDEFWNILRPLLRDAIRR